jgi:hypothetical protein
MPRGITQEQVNQTADAILGTGKNPTVEKIRAALGTGSPNTITRMLEIWRNQFGERLRRLSALPDVPAPVGQAMIDLWQMAVEHAERSLASRFEDARIALERATAHRLAKEREAMQVRLQAAQAEIAHARTARDLAEHACATLDGQLQDSRTLHANLVCERDRLQNLCDRQAEELRQLRDATR